MKQLLVLSGKGGTGKTTVSAAFIALSNAKACADCDVDAPNLHLVLGKEEKPETKDYYGLQKAVINQEICISCGLCKNACQFSAIEFDGEYKVEEFGCEGCAVCEYVCPVDAITMEEAVAGELMLYKKDKIFSTACLKMGSGTSGMLVSEVKKQMKENAEDAKLAIIDGSPGIGCPVIASISGVDMVLIVSEPSLSGISDMDRILKTVHTFQTKAAVCVNKYDTNPDITRKIEEYCEMNKLPFVGKIPYDKEAYKATNQGLTIVDVDCDSGKEVRKIYEKTMEILEP